MDEEARVGGTRRGEAFEKISVTVAFDAPVVWHGARNELELSNEHWMARGARCSGRGRWRSSRPCRISEVKTDHRAGKSGNDPEFRQPGAACL
jgi:hypothetical protein